MRSDPPAFSVRWVGRKLFALGAVVSLILFVAVCIVWVRSYWGTDKVNWRYSGGWRSVRSGEGHLIVEVLVADWSGHPREFHRPRYQRDVVRPPMNWLIFLSPESSDRWASWNRAGFAWHSRTRRDGVMNA